MSDDRVVKYDKCETVWNYAKILSKLPDTMLSESLIFKKNLNTGNCTEKESNTDSSYINYLEKRVLNLEELLDKEYENHKKTLLEKKKIEEYYEQLLLDLYNKYEVIKNYISNMHY